MSLTADGCNGPRDLLKLPWDCVIHSTRHTFCTRLGESGCDAFTIQKLAGHSSIVVSQRYVHPTPARLESSIGQLEAYTKSYTVTDDENVSV
jgi:integrase